MIIIAFMIKIKSPKGMVFFRQKRLGLGGKYFYVYKFRTIVPNAEEKLQYLLEHDKDIREEYLKYRKLKNDIRIIDGIGHFLRKTSLDELPQFFNVLFGDMSVVGPRPYMKAEFHQYPQHIINTITSIKPGITGYWQVIPTRHDTSFDERVRTDIAYIQKKDIWLDIEIIFKTVSVMVLRRGA
jgi:undecaprenyl-phosphate galactose phosphotransferase